MSQQTADESPTSTTPTAQRSAEALDAAACWSLLRVESVGRVAYVVDGRPMIAPVNFVVVADRIVFRSDPGDKLTWVPQETVCIEADGRDDPDHVWSVIAHGLARDVTNALGVEYESMRRTLVPTFAPLTDPHWISIDVESISGRRLSR
ncbi:MAG: pyridoxamine 5-phosphate oxidase family protein [Ilumatobacteraceae bacterium]|nr:pyridoxamine 5-phosphate oxidase family protein [Ilumatobacteraceae bacterium]